MKDDYVILVQNMLDNFRDIGSNISIKIYLLNSHLDRLSKNCSDVSNEQGERFYQDIKIIEERYLGGWDTKIMTDYCWSLKRGEDRYHSRQSRKRKFLPRLSSNFIG